MRSFVCDSFLVVLKQIVNLSFLFGGKVYFDVLHWLEYGFVDLGNSKKRIFIESLLSENSVNVFAKI